MHIPPDVKNCFIFVQLQSLKQGSRVVFIMIMCMYKMNTWSRVMASASCAWHLVKSLELHYTTFFPLNAESQT